MYGIPNMKLEKSVVDRRVELMRERGIAFRLETDATDPAVAEELLDAYDAVVVAAGARNARTLAVPGMDASGVVLALDYLTEATRALLDGRESALSAAGLDVVVIGGGDTGNDCVGTAVRQGARSVRQIEVMPEPPAERLPGNPWPEWPNVRKTDYGQEEAQALMGGEMRAWSMDTLEVLLDADGRARALKVADLDWTGERPQRIAGTERELPAQLVLIACGFMGPEASVLEAFDVALPEPGAGRPLPVMTTEGGHRCRLRDAARGDGAEARRASIWACGDARNGASLVVNAIADALACAHELAEELGL